MMQNRWRCSLLATALLLACSPFIAFAAPSATAAAASMATLKGNEAVSLRATLVSAAPPASSTVARSAYGGEVAAAFTPVAINTTNADASLNSAILIAQLQTLSCDKALETTLIKSPNPGARYWAAKGLADIMPSINSVGGSTQRDALASLTTALKSEKSGLVKQQIITAIVAAGDTHALVQGIEGLAASSESLPVAAGDRETLEVGSHAVSQLNTLATKSPLAAADATLAAKSAIALASLSVQHEVAMKTKRDSEQSDMPEGYHVAVLTLVNNSVKLLNTLSGKSTLEAVSAESPAELATATTPIFGTPTAPGAAQKLFTGVGTPPAFKPLANK